MVYSVPASKLVNVKVVFVVFSFHILPKPLARMMDTENPVAIYTASHCTRIESELGELTSRTGAASTTKAKTRVFALQRFGGGIILI